MGFNSGFKGLNTTRISVGLAAYLGIATATTSKEAKVTGVWSICQLILKCTEAKKNMGSSTVSHYDRMF